MEKNKWKSINFSSSFSNFLFLMFLLRTCLSEGDFKGGRWSARRRTSMGYFASAHHTPLTLLISTFLRIILYFFLIYSQSREKSYVCESVLVSFGRWIRGWIWFIYIFERKEGETFSDASSWRGKGGRGGRRASSYFIISANLYREDIRTSNITSRRKEWRLRSSLVWFLFLFLFSAVSMFNPQGFSHHPHQHSCPRLKTSHKYPLFLHLVIDFPWRFFAHKILKWNERKAKSNSWLWRWRWIWRRAWERESGNERMGIVRRNFCNVGIYKQETVFF